MRHRSPAHIVNSMLLSRVRFSATSRRRELRTWRQQRARTPQRWGVVAQVREPLELVLPFALHHLSIGASTVTLFFDDPDDPAAHVLDAIDGVTAIRCDTDFWRRIAGKRPEFFVPRRFDILRHVHATSSLDWIAQIDADEFLRPTAKGFQAAFDAFANSRAFWIKVMPHERVWENDIDESALFSGVFRSPLPGGASKVKKVYGTDSDHLLPAGMGGHRHGKPLTPRHDNLSPGVHTMFFDDPLFKGLRWRAPSVESADLQLLHFPALTFRHFALKHLITAAQFLDGRGVGTDNRSRIALAMLKAADPLAEARHWFGKGFVIDSETADDLAVQGYLDRTAFSVEDALRTHPAANGLSLSHAAIDARIEPELMAMLAEIKRRR